MMYPATLLPLSSSASGALQPPVTMVTVSLCLMVCVCVCVCACACVHVRERSPSPRQDTGSDWYGPCQKGQHISNLEYLLLVISQTVSLSSKSITHDSVHVHLNQAKRYSNNINKQDGNVMFFSLNFFRRFRCQLKNVLLISL